MKPLPISIRTLASELDQARRAKGLSFKKLGDRSGVDAGQAFRICHGDFATYSQNVLRICIALGVDLPLGGVIGEHDGPNDGRLHAALVAAWDKSPEGADRLVRLLDAVAAYRL